MLVLFDMPKNQIHTFNNYGKLYNHLKSLERDKGKAKWIFTCHSHHHVFAFYRYICMKSMTPQEKEEKEGLYILEIVRGDVKKPVFIPVTPDVDIESLRARWCQTYCKAHHYVLMDVSSPSDFRQPVG